jgi:adenine-specific DNA-methyltransferase
VQCIYVDPPYGIKFNSNFQWSTTSRDVKDGAKDHITREPEQVRAFRDTWRDGIHSYLTYLRDRLTVARDLLHESGSIFVQIGNENVHRVRALMDEVLGEANFISQITFRKTTGKGSSYLDNTFDVVLWFAKDRDKAKYRTLYFRRRPSDDFNYRYGRNEAGELRPLTKIELENIDEIAAGVGVAAANPMTSQSSSSTTLFEYELNDARFSPGKGDGRQILEGWRGLENLHAYMASAKHCDSFAHFPISMSNPTTIYGMTHARAALAMKRFM